MACLKHLRVLELYSGIGGMHCALKESGIPFEVILAIDINPTANKVYRHAFPQSNLTECGIETLTVQQLDEMKIDMIVMSPPCQPFTRVGKKLDTVDLRTKSFLHLLSLLPKLRHCPQYILVENVKGFEMSQTRDALVETLRTCGFNFQECLLTPLQFGIPNSRLRYYLIAKRSPLKFSFKTDAKILDQVPDFADKWLSYKTGKRRGGKKSNLVREEEEMDSQTAQGTNTGVTKCEDINNHPDPDNGYRDCRECQDDCSRVDRKTIEEKYHWSCDEKYRRLLEFGHNMRQVEEGDSKLSEDCLSLGHFLEKQSEEDFHQYKLPDKELKRFIVMDIVHPCLTKTICFTKRYGHFMEGAGSIVQMTTDVEAVKKASEFKTAAVELKNRDQWDEHDISIIRSLKLRYFTPREIANLLCFPQSYSFPDDLSRIQAYRVLGNSLNVHVVSVLLRMLVEGD